MAKNKISEEKTEELLTRGVEQVIGKEKLEEKIRSGRKLRVKHGVDPTTKDLHLGYATIYHKLRQLQDMGHTVIFLIGDFTARFGDPTDQKKGRKMRDRKEVLELAKNYLKQAGKILDMKKAEVRYNGEWYDKMSAEELLGLQSRFTYARMIERDMFQERIRNSQEIGMHELTYPILQAYDSVVLKSDLTIIGSDQTFNELQGRKLQEDFGQKPQDIIAMSLLVGTDGTRKMSQSLGNYIGITESPAEQYGKTMSVPDHVIIHYFRLATRVPMKEIKEMEESLKAGVNPRDLKARLAREIVAIYHGEGEARKAEEEFDRIFREKKKPAEMPEVRLAGKKYKIIDLLTEAGLAKSKGEARRLVEQRGIRIDDRTVEDWQEEIEAREGMIVQAGKRRFVKIVS